MNLFLRAMISLDLPEVAAIDRSARDPLPLRRLREWLHFAPPRPRIGLVAECRDPGPLEYAPVGFALYTVRRGRLTLDRLAVRPDCRRQGVGRRLVADVQRRTLTHCVPRVVCTVPETDLSALCFLRACGVTPARLVSGRYGDADGVRFVMPGGLRVPAGLSAGVK